MENPIKMDDLGITLFLETPIYYKGFWDGNRNLNTKTTLWGGTGILQKDLVILKSPT